MRLESHIVIVATQNQRRLFSPTITKLICCGRAEHSDYNTAQGAEHRTREKKSLITSKHDLFFHALLMFMASRVECMRTFFLLLGKCVEKITDGGRRVNEITWILQLQTNKLMKAHYSFGKLIMRVGENISKPMKS